MTCLTWQSGRRWRNWSWWSSDKLLFHSTIAIFKQSRMALTCFSPSPWSWIWLKALKVQFINIPCLYFYFDSQLKLTQLRKSWTLSSDSVWWIINTCLPMQQREIKKPQIGCLKTTVTNRRQSCSISSFQAFSSLCVCACTHFHISTYVCM